VRNTGGAGTAAVLVVIVAPPLIEQLKSGAISWIPATPCTVLSGVTVDKDMSTLSAGFARTGWPLVPAAIGLAAMTRRDIA